MATADVVEAGKRADPQLTEPMMQGAVASDTTSARLGLRDGRLAIRAPSKLVSPAPEGRHTP